ncbi:MAG: hypothetical protein MJ252_08415 [archaeon]|nr:hypothetical protein [archaeon]
MDEITMIKSKYESIQKQRAQYESQIVKKCTYLMGKIVESVECFKNSIIEAEIKPILIKSKLFLNLIQILLSHLEKEIKEEEEKTNKTQNKMQFLQLYKAFVIKCQNQIYQCCSVISESFNDMNPKLEKKDSLRSEYSTESELSNN